MSNRNDGQGAPDDAALVPNLMQALDAERAARTAAERVNVMRDEFLGLVSHELRTPLNAMVGWLHVLESVGDTGGQIAQRAVAGLGRAVHQQRELVDTLLETARALRGDLVLAPERVDLNAIVAAAAQARQQAAPALTIEFGGPTAEHPVIADPQRLRYVFDELFSHAARFADLGALQVQVAGDADGVGRVAVSLGFGSAEADVAWEPFREPEADASGTPLRRRRGIGIGLVLCQRLVELSGGTLRVRGSAPAALQVVLPGADGQAGAAAADPARGPAHAQHTIPPGLDVLIVDDQSEMREVLSTLLAQAGARVHVAASAAEGASRYAELASSDRLDLGVLDIAMPVEDGIGLVRRIREQERVRQWRRRPMIALTAHASATIRDQALEAGFDLFLAKPLLPDDLYEAIIRVVPDRR